MSRSQKTLSSVAFVAALLSVLLVHASTAALAAPKYPFQNWTLPPDVRARDLISRLTLNEKASEMVSMAPGVPRLEWPAFNWRSECCHGWGFTGSDWQGSGWNGTATVFPQVIGLAASFSKELVQAVGDVASTEGRAVNNMAVAQNISGHMMSGLHCFGPTTNLVRAPQWGRIKRTWGEDPILVGALAAAHVQGLQGNDANYTKISSDLNMYAVHSGPDSIRTQFSAITGPRDMFESYLVGFQVALDGGAQTVMVAYSALNHTPDNANELLLTKILKDKFNFTGVAFSDNTGVKFIADKQKYAKDYPHAAADALNAGLDQDMASGGPSHSGGWDFGGTIFASALLQAVGANLTTEKQMDEALLRIYRIRLKTGADDPQDLNPWKDLGPSTIGRPEHLELAHTAARKSMVLLRNDHQTLPLKRGMKVAVVGPNGNRTDLYFGGTYSAFPTASSSSVTAALETATGSPVVFSPGCEDIRCASSANFADTLKAVKSADIVVFAGGLDGDTIEKEGGDRGTEDKNWTDGYPCDGEARDVLSLPGCQDKLISQMKAANKTVVAVLFNAGAVSVQSEPDAILQAFYPGQAGGEALADVLFGVESPAGRLPYTSYFNSSQLPPFMSYDMRSGPGFTYRFNKNQPQFQFGFGLSYTTFSYSDLQLSAPSVPICSSVNVSVTITNTGAMSSDEVVQVYLSSANHNDGVDDQPLLELKAFTRLPISHGSSARVWFELTPFQLSVFDPSLGDRALKASSWQISVGGQQPSIGEENTALDPQPLENVVTAKLTLKGSTTPWSKCADSRLIGPDGHGADAA